jgi:hypothetical protein
LAEKSALQSLLEWVDSADVQALNHIGSSADGDSAVGVDLDNVVGTGGSFAELGWILYTQEHLLPRLIVEGVRLEARATVLLVNDHLAMVAEECKVSKERDVQNRRG